jgi:hypothetical protein
VVAVNSTIFCDITSCSLLKVSRRSGGTYRLHRQGWRKIWARYPSEISSCCLLSHWNFDQFVLQPWRLADFEQTRQHYIHVPLVFRHNTGRMCHWLTDTCHDTVSPLSVSLTHNLCPSLLWNFFLWLVHHECLLTPHLGYLISNIISVQLTREVIITFTLSFGIRRMQVNGGASMTQDWNLQGNTKAPEPFPWHLQVTVKWMKVD